MDGGVPPSDGEDDSQWLLSRDESDRQLAKRARGAAAANDSITASTAVEPSKPTVCPIGPSALVQAQRGAAVEEVQLWAHVAERLRVRGEEESSLP